MRRMLVVGLTSALALGALAVPAGAEGNPTPAHSVVVSNLNNPRQIDWSSNGHLYIAEAGAGGATCSDDGCLGLTGSITDVANAGKANNVSPNRVVTGLMSLAGPDGSFAVGADGVSRRGNDSIFIQQTYGPPDIGQLPGGDQLGMLLRSKPNIPLQGVANISAIELNQNPAGGPIDSNPYSVLALRGRQIVADAAGDTLIDVRAGKAKVCTVIPGPTDENGDPILREIDDEGTLAPADSVPTSLALGPDGWFYVGTLASEIPGEADVWRVSPDCKQKEVVATGFSSITGVAVANDGTLYVSELFGGSGDIPGQIVKVAPNGTRTEWAVPLPAGLALDRSGHLFAAVWSVIDADGADPFGIGQDLPPGQVWRFNV